MDMQNKCFHSLLGFPQITPITQITEQTELGFPREAQPSSEINLRNQRNLRITSFTTAIATALHILATATILKRQCSTVCLSDLSRQHQPNA
jgi:hypothetical protein